MRSHCRDKHQRHQRKVNIRPLTSPKLKEFQYKLIHRIVVTKKELYRYGIKEDDECIYCGEKDSINHTFRDCHFVKIFIQRVINWFNIENKINLNPSSEERLFGILSDLHEKVLVSM